MKSTKTKKLLFILACTISIVYIILLIFSEANVHERDLAGDEGSYLGAMNAIYFGNIHITRPPGYPTFLYALNEIPYLTSSESSNLIYITQFVFWVLTIRMLLLFFPEKNYWIWGALFTLVIINPSFVQYTYMILTESLFLFIIMFSFISLRKHFKNKKDAHLIGFVACVLIATLVRPGLLYFSLLVIGFSLFIFIKKNRFLASACVAGLAIIFLALPMRVMKNTFGHYTISYIDKITQYRYINARATTLIEGGTLDFEIKKRTFFVNDAYDNARLAKLVENINTETKNLIIQHPLEYGQAFFQNLYMNFHSGNEYLPTKIPIIGKHFFGLSRILNMLFVILLLVCTVMYFIRFFQVNQKSSLVFSGVLLSYCFYCWLTSGISFWQGDRFNVIWIPVLVIFMFHFFSNSKNEKAST